MKIDEVVLSELFGIKRRMNLRRATAAGQKDMQATADKLEREFANSLGFQGKNMKTASWNDVIDFLSSKNVDTSQIDTTLPLDTRKLFKDVVIKAKAQSGRKAPPATGSASPAAGSTATPAAKPKTPGAAPSSTSAPASSSYSQTLGSAQKLSAKEKRRLIQQLQKTLPPTKVPPVPLGGRTTT